jgi:hypothetical protein
MSIEKKMPQRNDNHLRDGWIAPNPLLSEAEVFIKEEKHYRIVTNEDLTDEEIVGYRSRRDET